MISTDIGLLPTLSRALDPDIACASSTVPLVATRGSPCSSSRSTESEVSEGESNSTEQSEDSTSSYFVGATFPAFRHEPPGPFGRGYYNDVPATLENWRSLPRKEYCCTRIPIGGHASHEARKALTITAIVRTGHSNGAQLVVVNDCMVAKIFDPLCYNDKSEFGSPEDVVLLADGDYSREAAAYQVLQKSPATQEVTPAFYGTWVIELDTFLLKDGHVQKHIRRVPLILMEHVRGICMRDINPRSLPEEQRSLILKKALEAEIILYHAGMSHGDMHPRNIMVLGMNCEGKFNVTDALTVKLIDFNIAYVFPSTPEGRKKYLSEEDKHAAACSRLINPICRFFRGMTEFSLDGWCPHDEEIAPELWLWEQFHDDERYLPVFWDAPRLETSPKYVGLVSDADNNVDSDWGSDMEVENEEEVSGRKDSGQARD